MNVSRTQRNTENFSILVDLPTRLMVDKATTHRRRLFWPIRAVAILAWLLMASSLMAEIRDVREEIAQQTKQYIAQHFPDGKMPPKHDFSKNQSISKGRPKISDHKANTINGPTPGGIGYGLWYDNTALLWTNFTIADYYVIAPPAIGGTVSWLYLTSTCRAQLGTESLVAYTSSTSGPQFWIFDWSQINSPWQVMIDLPANNPQYLTTRPDEFSITRQMAHVRNATYNTGFAGGLYLWNNQTLLFNFNRGGGISSIPQITPLRAWQTTFSCQAAGTKEAGGPL